MVKLSHPYMTTGKAKAWTIWTFVGKVMSAFKTLSRFVIAFLTRSKHLLISYLQSPQEEQLKKLRMFSLERNYRNSHQDYISTLEGKLCGIFVICSVTFRGDT